LIDRPRFVGGMILRIEVLQSRQEAVAHAMLLVEVDGTLNGYVTNGITVREVFGYDTAAWLLFLSDLVAVTGLIGGVVASVVFC